ncbi:MAG: ATP phosphoribosyltransferase regulatory subunit [Acidobacteriota bacterium]|nr:ATP phosphoribosyltransferase regulatory subunit [Acidobacteriota bacterium]
MSKVLPAKGFRDFTPGVKRRKEELLSTIRACYLRYGFDEIETPVAEPIERLRGSEGGENLAMIFEILRRGLTAEDVNTAGSPAELCDLGLRYDLTVPLARYYATNHAELPPVFRAIQIGPVWRAEKPQKGRYRQFTQCDIDILGEPSALAEIELIVATLEALRDIGLRDATVRINDRRFLDALIAGAGLGAESKARALILIDKVDKVGLDGVIASLAEAFPGGSGDALGATLRALADAQDVTIEQFLERVPSCDSAAVGEHQAIVTSVRAVAGGASIRFDPTLVRGLGYYTGPIFEVRHPASRGSVGGGGRYDNMIGKFLGEKVPASGFSLGFDRLLEIIGDLASSAGASPDRVGLLYEDTDAPARVIERQQTLLARGLTVRLVRSARNKTRMFDELLRAGYGRVQRMADEASAFRDLGGHS